MAEPRQASSSSTHSIITPPRCTLDPGVELWQLSDEDLARRVEWLSDAGPDSEALWEALAEVFRRMRAEAKPEKLAYVEAVIRRLTWSFSQRDDEDEAGGGPADGGGVREPRRPTPSGGRGGAVALPDRRREAA